MGLSLFNSIFNHHGVGAKLAAALEPGITISLSDAPIEMDLLVESLEVPQVSLIRLTAMGLLKGENVMVLRRDPDGPMLIKVKGTRVAIGSEVGRNVKVTIK